MRLLEKKELKHFLNKRNPMDRELLISAKRGNYRIAVVQLKGKQDVKGNNKQSEKKTERME